MDSSETVGLSEIALGTSFGISSVLATNGSSSASRASNFWGDDNQ